MKKGLLALSLLALTGIALAQFNQNRNLPTKFPIDCRAVDRCGARRA